MFRLVTFVDTLPVTRHLYFSLTSEDYLISPSRRLYVRSHYRRLSPEIILSYTSTGSVVSTFTPTHHIDRSQILGRKRNIFAKYLKVFFTETTPDGPLMGGMSKDVI